MDFNDYNKQYNIGSLRKILSDMGGTPGSKNKTEIIEDILKIESGELMPVRSRRGRPSCNRKVNLHDSNSNLVSGVLELVPEGYGFLRAVNCDNSLKDSFIAKPTIKASGLREGDFIEGKIEKKQEAKLPEVVKVVKVNGRSPEGERPRFDELMPVYPDRRINLEGEGLSSRVIDMFMPVGYGQRGLIVAPPKTGKTTLLKDIAMSIEKNHSDIKLFVFLVDERPEEVTDFRQGLDCEVVYSTFDCSPEHHIRIAELFMKRMKRLVESGYDVVVLMDSLTKLVRAYNSVLPPSGKVLTGGLDPQALVTPKKFFGMARNTEKGSLTVIATTLVETGSRMDDVIFEEFKGTGNMEIVLSRQLAERRVFPAIDVKKSGTRKEELLLKSDELECSYALRRAIDDVRSVETLLEVMKNTRSNAELVARRDECSKAIKRQLFEN